MRPLPIGIKSSRSVGFATTPMNTLGSFDERNAVKDFSDNLRRLRDGHSRAVEKEIPVPKYEVAVLHGSQFLPPRIALQYTSFSQTPLQIKSAGSHDQVLGIGVAKLFGGDGGRVFAFLAQQKFAIRDVHQGMPTSWRRAGLCPTIAP